MLRISDRTAYGTSAGAGALVWIVIALATSRPEAWDSATYWLVGIPCLCLVAAWVSIHAPDEFWRWPVIMVATQAVAAFTLNPFGNLWPLGLVVFAIIAIPLLVSALTAAVLFKLVRRARNI